MNTIFSKHALLIAACMTFAVVTSAQKQPPNVYGLHIDNGKETYSTTKNGKSYEMEFADGKMTSLTINNVAIPEEKWSEYNSLITEIKEQIKRDKKQAEVDRAQADKDRQQATLDRIQADKDRQRAQLDKVRADKDRLRADSDRARAEKDRFRYEEDRKQTELDRQQADKDRAQADEERKQADEDRKQADEDRAEAAKDREQAKLDRIQADKDREQAAKDRIQADKDRAQAAEDRKVMESLEADLVSDKIVNSKSEIREVTLNDDELIVNGNKQSAALYQKYQSKYKAYSGRGITYKADGAYKSFKRYK